MKKHILVISALLITAIACQPKERQKSDSCQKGEASAGIFEEEESCRTISEEFSMEEEQFKAIEKKLPEVIVEDLVQQMEEKAPLEPVVEFGEEQEKQQSVVESSFEEKTKAMAPETAETGEKTLSSPVVLEEAPPIPESI